MRDFFFDIPWWIPAGFALVGIVIWLTGKHRGERRLQRKGYLPLLVAVVLSLVSYLGQTDTEKASAQARRIVAAANEQNWTAMRAALDPNTSFAMYADRDQITWAAGRAVAQYGVKSVRVLSMETKQTDGVMTVTFDVISFQDATMGRPIVSTWEMEWQQTPESTWVLETITLLRAGQESGESVQRYLPKK